MRLLPTIVIPALALLVMSCGPHRHHGMGHQGEYGHGACGRGGQHGTMHGCGPESCYYKSQCFSSGAASSNDGVCQACSGGKWVQTGGCSDEKPCDGCGMKGKKGGPCHHHGEPGHHHPH